MKKIATEENITQARKELIDEHQDVTVENIRQRIGGGSYNTITQTLRKLNEQEAASIINQPDPDEDQVIAEEAMPFVKALFQICKKRADTLAMLNYQGLQLISKDIETKAAKLDEIEEIYEARAKISESEVIRLKEENEALKQQNKLLNDSLQEARNSLQEAREALKTQQKFEQGYEEIKKQLTALSKAKQAQDQNKAE